MQQQVSSQGDLLMRAQARAELERQKRDERYKFYVPNGKIEQFIKLIGSGNVFVALLSAANGVGKTAAGCNILAHILFECSCGWFDLPLFKSFPFLKKGRIASDPTTIEQQIAPELEIWLPKGKYTPNKAGRSFNSKFTTVTGHEFDLMTYEQDTKEFESVSLGWAWFDEPPPEDKYKATVSRMRRGGIIWITQTPLTGSAWMYDSFITSKDRII